MNSHQKDLRKFVISGAMTMGQTSSCSAVTFQPSAFFKVSGRKINKLESFICNLVLVHFLVLFFFK